MRKYATKAFAPELARATDMWGEAVVLVLARLNLVERNMIKVKEGYAVLPLISQDLLAGLWESVPPALASDSPSVCFQASESSPLSKPLSFVMLQRIRRVIEDCIPSSVDAPSAARTQPEAEQQLKKLGKSVNDLLMASVTRIYEELSDVVTFAGLPIASAETPAVLTK